MPLRAGINKLSNNLRNSANSLPLDGGGLGGGDKMEMESEPYLITLPLIPSRQGRGNRLLGGDKPHSRQAKLIYNYSSSAKVMSS